MAHYLVLNLQESVDSFVSECKTNSFQVCPSHWFCAPKNLVFLLIFRAVLAVCWLSAFCTHMELSPITLSNLQTSF